MVRRQQSETASSYSRGLVEASIFLVDAIEIRRDIEADLSKVCSASDIRDLTNFGQVLDTAIKLLHLIGATEELGQLSHEQHVVDVVGG